MLVIAILTVLALLMVTLTYVAQVELQATENWNEGLQATVSAVTGLPEFSGTSGGSAGGMATVASTADSAAASRVLLSLGKAQMRRPPNPDEPAAAFSFTNSSNGIARRGNVASSNGSIIRRGSRIEPQIGLDASPRQLPVVRGAIAFSQVEDESAKINLNTLIPSGGERASDREAETLEKLLTEPEYQPRPAMTSREFGNFLEGLLREKKITPRVSAHTLAERIAEYRYGRDGKPGVANVDDNGNGRPMPRGETIEISGAEEAQVRFRRRSGSLPSTEIVEMPDGTFIRRADPAQFGLQRGGRSDQTRYLERDGLDNDLDGEIDEYQEGIDEPEEAISDLRQEPAGDDRMFYRLEDLRRIRGMSESVIQALAPYVTVFSASRPGAPFQPDDEEGLVQLDPNRASAEEIFALLRARYPHLPEELIGQFTANIIDRRDADKEPVELVLGKARKTYRGIELTPYINEVMPDVITFPEDGDNGQYIEIYNPWSTSFNLTGWRVETSSSVVLLEGFLPSEGLLVITDDYDNANDPMPEKEPGMGSLFDIFGTVSVPPQRRVMEAPQFDLVDARGSVRLYNEQGTLVDSFHYEHGIFTGAHESFQRADPRVQAHQRKMATPLDPNPGARRLSEEDKEMLGLIEALHDRPFNSALELLLVSSSYLPEEDRGDEDARTTYEMSWRFPAVDGADEDNLDAGIVDAFLPGAPPVEPLDARRNRGRGLDDFEDGAWESIESLLGGGFKAPGAVHGRININTAAPAVIASLPGIDAELAERIALVRGQRLAMPVESEEFDETEDWIEEPTEEDLEEDSRAPLMVGEQTQLMTRNRETRVSGINGRNRVVVQRRRQDRTQSGGVNLPEGEWYQARSPQDTMRWDSLAQLLRDDQLWQDATLFERIEKLYPLTGLITFHSLSYKVTTQNVPMSVAEGGDKRRPSIKRAERILTADNGELETVSFRYQRRKFEQVRELEKEIGKEIERRTR